MAENEAFWTLRSLRTEGCRRLNTAMQRALVHAGRAGERTLALGAARNLVSLLESRLIVVGGALVLEPLLPAAHHDPSAFSDRTAFECFVNHVVVEDWIELEADDDRALLAAGVEAADRLWERLCAIGENARVILSADGHDCTLTFHRVRDGEAWLTEDPEAYRCEAILVLDTEARKVRTHRDRPGFMASDHP